PTSPSRPWTNRPPVTSRMISAKWAAVPLGESFLNRWCRSTISASKPFPLSASAVSRTSLKSRLTTRLMFGANSTAVSWAAASISAFWASVWPVVATTSGILRATQVGGSAIVPGGAERSMPESARAERGTAPVEGVLVHGREGADRVCVLRPHVEELDGVPPDLLGHHDLNRVAERELSELALMTISQTLATLNRTTLFGSASTWAARADSRAG